MKGIQKLTTYPNIEPAIDSESTRKSEPRRILPQRELTTSCAPYSYSALPSADHIPRINTLPVRYAQLQDNLQKVIISNRKGGDHLLQIFKIQSARIESERIANLYQSSAAPAVLPIVNKYFDMQQHSLIDNIELQIHCLTYQFLAREPPSSSVLCNENINQNPSPKGPKLSSTSTTVTASNNKDLEARILDGCMNSNHHSLKKTKPNPLNRVAVRIMNNWYERNRQNPYPSNETSEVIAKAGNITDGTSEEVVCQQTNEKLKHETSKTSTQ